MSDESKVYSQILGIGIVDVLGRSTENLIEQYGIDGKVFSSKWGHNPIETSHKELPYPYCV